MEAESLSLNSEKSKEQKESRICVTSHHVANVLEVEILPKLCRVLPVLHESLCRCVLLEFECVHHRVDRPLVTAV